MPPPCSQTPTNRTSPTRTSSRSHLATSQAKAPTPQPTPTPPICALGLLPCSTPPTDPSNPKEIIMDRIQQSAARQLFTTADTLGLQLPKPVLQARARVEKIRLGVESIPAHRLTGVAAAVADALGRDADPLTDPEVVRAIALNVITGQGVL